MYNLFYHIISYSKVLHCVLKKSPLGKLSLILFCFFSVVLKTEELEPGKGLVGTDD